MIKEKIVEPKGFEPMTSALSKQRSKPTELRFLIVLRIYLNAEEIASD